MYRKRRGVPPHFRLPVPYNPVAGSDAPLHPPFKPYCRFVLNEDLTTSDEEVKATITTPQQWGPGMYHCPEVVIHVHNFPTTTDGVYKFTGFEGEDGFAVWDHNNHWRIVWVGPDGLRGGCLAENHPGRGNPFSIHLGTWDKDQDKWVYEEEDTVTAIDWRFDVPYPDAGATGLFEPRESTAYGEIWETVALDCDTPGDCGD